MSQLSFSTKIFCNLKDNSVFSEAPALKNASSKFLTNFDFEDFSKINSKVLTHSVFYIISIEDFYGCKYSPYCCFIIIINIILQLVLFDE